MLALTQLKSLRSFLLMLNKERAAQQRRRKVEFKNQVRNKNKHLKVCYKIKRVRNLMTMKIVQTILMQLIKLLPCQILQIYIQNHRLILVR